MKNKTVFGECVLEKAREWEQTWLFLFAFFNILSGKTT